MSDSGVQTGSRFRKLAEFFRSDIFIIVAVVLVIVFLAIAVICCIHRRRQNQRLLTQRLTQIVVVRAGAANENGRPSYTLRIQTDQDHATKLVGLITGHPYRSSSAPVLHRYHSSASTLDPAEPGWRNLPDHEDLYEYLAPGHTSLPAFLTDDSAIPALLKASQSAPNILSPRNPS
ncbi:hypothetical protein COCON_G00228480 [Conger conger]|uniref:Uncharacterized protein n=1 Tax=Conger conger TaxID=82655 RepID=A0A9Q1HLS2_CONCO|nr:hypothetical protein COCON_G00228480 [Conger conger]